MELGTLQIQIFVSLVVVLGTAFVAFLCDFLKGNNEQLRERNIEMRVRQDERERWGVVHPGSLLKSIEALVRNAPAISVAPAEEPAPAASPVETEVQQPSTWEQPIMAPAARGSAWASKEELEKLAERAARIRERHESKKATDGEFAEEESAVEEPLVLASVTEMPAEVIAEIAAEEPKAEEEIVAEEASVAAEAAFETVAEPVIEPLAEPVPEVISAEAIFEAAQETPPPLMVEEVDSQASAEAEAIPALEPVVIEPGKLELVEEAEPDEPASHIELQPLAITEMPSYEAPPAGQVARGDEPAAIAPGPELVMKPMGTATIIPSEPDELLAQEAEASEGEFEPELLRVRVVPIDQSSAGVEEIINSIVEAPAEPAAEAPPEQSAEVNAPESLAPVEVLPVDEPVASEPELLETDTTNVAELENAAAIGSLHESLVAEETGLPRGLHTAEVLRDQIKANAPFQGVAVSIGINDYEALKQKLDTQGGADSLASIEKMIRGMLKEPDFACRFQDDEYILLFPGEADSAAQRRLFQISEKLWDFQLRSLGHHSIMFSWGGLEVKRDSLSDAVSAARERMFQTKRNRTGAIEMRKRVVNG